MCFLPIRIAGLQQCQRVVTRNENRIPPMKTSSTSTPRMQPMPPTTRELAAALGVSHNTVARALRNDPEIALATKNRILKAAGEAGYRMNPLVSALMNRVRRRGKLESSGEVIGFLTSYTREDRWRTHPSLSEHYRGAHTRAEELGFQLEPFWLGTGGVDSARVGRVLRARGIRGAIIGPVLADYHPFRLDWDHLAVVAIGAGFRQVPVHRITHHQTTGMQTCYAHLRQFGYKRIGFVSHLSDDSRIHHLWRAGYLAAQQVHGGDRLEIFFTGSYEEPEPVRSWLKREKPDAVIGTWVHPLLQELHVRIPERLGFASLDIMTAQLGQLAGIWQDNERIGAVAMDLLAGQIYRNETSLPKAPTLTHMEGTWMDGPTVRRQPGKRSP